MRKKLGSDILILLEDYNIVINILITTGVGPVAGGGARYAIQKNVTLTISKDSNGTIINTVTYGKQTGDIGFIETVNMWYINVYPQSVQLIKK